MTIRLEILDFLSALQNEVMLFDIDRDASQFQDDPKIIDKFRQTIAVLERLFPMIQAIDEVYLGDITPKLFWKKWDKVKEHFDFPDDEIEEIGDDVKRFLGGFGPEGESA